LFFSTGKIITDLIYPLNILKRAVIIVLQSVALTSVHPVVKTTYFFWGGYMSLTDYNLKHKIGEYVIYRQIGICQIVDIRKENFDSSVEKTYYVLKAMSDKTIIYVPVDSQEIELFMRHILTADKIQSIIDKAETAQNEWIEDSKLRANYFEQLLQNGNRSEILWIVKVLSLHKIDVEKSNRKFYVSDERILAKAEKLIIDEFAYILGVEKSQVIPYIISHIKQKQ